MTGDGTSFEKNCSVREPGVGGGGKNGLQVGTVDGSEIRRSPVEVGSLSHVFSYRIFYIRSGRFHPGGESWHPGGKRGVVPTYIPSKLVSNMIY